MCAATANKISNNGRDPSSFFIHQATYNELGTGSEGCPTIPGPIMKKDYWTKFKNFMNTEGSGTLFVNP